MQEKTGIQKMKIECPILQKQPVKGGWAKAGKGFRNQAFSLNLDPGLPTVLCCDRLCHNQLGGLFTIPVVPAGLESHLPEIPRCSRVRVHIKLDGV